VVEHVAEPVVQPAASKTVEKPAAPKTTAKAMAKLKIGTSVLASFIGSGTMKGTITKQVKDAQTNTWKYHIKFTNGEIEILQQGLMNKKGQPAKKNQAVPNYN
jgi:hypothetical protein